MSVKSSIAKFFIEQLLGRYLDKESLSAEQLEVSVASGEGSMSDIKLNTQVRVALAKSFALTCDLLLKLLCVCHRKSMTCLRKLECHWSCSMALLAT